MEVRITEVENGYVVAMYDGCEIKTFIWASLEEALECAGVELKKA